MGAGPPTQKIAHPLLGGAVASVFRYVPPKTPLALLLARFWRQYYMRYIFFFVYESMYVRNIITDMSWRQVDTVSNRCKQNIVTWAICIHLQCACCRAFIPVFSGTKSVFKNPPRNIKVIVKNDVAHVYGPPYILVSLTGNSRL